MCVAPVPLKVKTVKNDFNKVFTNVKSDVLNVPCGKCIDCRRSHINGWVFRLINEFKAKTTQRAYFLTLTYNDANLPVTEDGEVTLDYRDHQLYMKRLRKMIPDNKIKYFTTGEYGDRTGRPHFHSIIFNADQQSILNAWEKGNVHFGEVNEKTIAYTLKYAMKKVGRVYKKDTGKDNTTRERERALISKGIGADYINEKTIKYYQDDITRQVVKEGGLLIALPRYYKKRIYTESQQTARGRLLSKRMADIRPEDLREKQKIQRKAFDDHEKKQTKRTFTGD